jgi:hypothetical protein
LSTTLKMLIGMLVAGLALAMVTLTAMPGTAEAHTWSGPSTAEQNTNRDTNGHTGAANATTDRSSSSEPAVGRRVVGPGESLWSITQEQLGPNAAPDRVADELGRIYGSNRDRIGGDPNFVLVGQEIIVSPAAVGPVSVGGEGFHTTEEPAAASEAEYVGAKPAALPTERATTETASSHGQPAEEEALAGEAVEENDGPVEEPAEEPVIKVAKVAPEPAAEEEPAPTEPEGVGGETPGELGERQLLGLAILLLTVAAVILMVWRLPINRLSRESSPYVPYTLREAQLRYSEHYAGYYNNYAPPPQRERKEEEEQQEEEGEEQATEVETSEQAEVETSISGTSVGPATTGPADLSNGETILLSKVFLERCLEERLGRDEPTVLDSREREFLELVARSATFRDEIAVPKELLEAFLAKN